MTLQLLVIPVRIWVVQLSCGRLLDVFVQKRVLPTRDGVKWVPGGGTSGLLSVRTWVSLCGRSLRCSKLMKWDSSAVFGVYWELSDLHA